MGIRHLIRDMTNRLEDCLIPAVSVDHSPSTETVEAESVEARQEKIKFNKKVLTACPTCGSRKLSIRRGEGFFGTKYVLEVRCQKCRNIGHILVSLPVFEQIRNQLKDKVQWDDVNIVPRR